MRSAPMSTSAGWACTTAMNMPFVTTRTARTRVDVNRDTSVMVRKAACELATITASMVTVSDLLNTSATAIWDGRGQTAPLTADVTIIQHASRAWDDVMNVKTGLRESFVSRVSPAVTAMRQPVRGAAAATVTTTATRRAACVTSPQENVYVKITPKD